MRVGFYIKGFGNIKCHILYESLKRNFKNVFGRTLGRICSSKLKYFFEEIINIISGGFIGTLSRIQERLLGIIFEK